MISKTKQFLVVFFLLFGMGSGMVYADLQAGWDAAQKEDYETALREWKPLAEAGDAVAQYIPSQGPVNVVCTDLGGIVTCYDNQGNTGTATY
jgi:hypothetical protein